MKREIEDGPPSPPPSPPPGWLARLFGLSRAPKGQPHLKTEAIRREMWGLLGINAWSNTLYYDFTPI